MSFLAGSFSFGMILVLPVAYVFLFGKESNIICHVKVTIKSKGFDNLSRKLRI